MRKGFVTVDERQIKVLSNPVRLQILALLFEEERTLSQIAAKVELTPATIHHHLTRLLRAKLIRHTRSVRKGNLVEKYYTVPASGVDSSRVWADLSDRDKVAYRLSTLGMLKALIDRGTRTLQRRGTVEFDVGKIVFYRLPWRGDVLQQVNEIMAKARQELSHLEERHRGSEGDRVMAVFTVLPG
ncbi:MAG TPA: winged helix-turn-helix domain-containing protein [Thermoplasmata archaeon]|nr:winged helix-turn-helix domain-containing protein [Thermoplasmata archaeon]